MTTPPTAGNYAWPPFLTLTPGPEIARRIIPPQGLSPQDSLDYLITVGGVWDIAHGYQWKTLAVNHETGAFGWERIDNGGLTNEFANDAATTFPCVFAGPNPDPGCIPAVFSGVYVTGNWRENTATDEFRAIRLARNSPTLAPLWEAFFGTAGTDVPNRLVISKVVGPFNHTNLARIHIAGRAQGPVLDLATVVYDEVCNGACP